MWYSDKETGIKILKNYQNKMFIQDIVHSRKENSLYHKCMMWCQRAKEHKQVLKVAKINCGIRWSTMLKIFQNKTMLIPSIFKISFYFMIIIGSSSYISLYILQKWPDKDHKFSNKYRKVLISDAINDIVFYK